MRMMKDVNMSLSKMRKASRMCFEGFRVLLIENMVRKNFGRLVVRVVLRLVYQEQL